MAFDRSTLPALKDIIAQHNLRAEKKFGQNFLLDQNITDKIVRCAPDLTHTHVFEIGPGPGGLTRSLLHINPQSLTAIELDPRATQALQHLTEAAPQTLTLIEKDALTLDLTTLTPSPRAIVANLPYNVATPLLITWLSHIAKHGDQAFTSMTLMFQKEVTDRIIAQPGSKTYSRISVLCQWLCHVKQAYILPAEAFTPPPKVKSAIVTFLPKPQTLNAPQFKAVEAVTEAAFGQRRKMIRQSLKQYSNALATLGLNPTLRAENIPPATYIALAQLGPNTKHL